jgi:hypothetical protein
MRSKAKKTRKDNIRTMNRSSKKEPSSHVHAFDSTVQSIRKLYAIKHCAMNKCMHVNAHTNTHNAV